MCSFPFSTCQFKNVIIYLLYTIEERNTFWRAIAGYEESDCMSMRCDIGKQIKQFCNIPDTEEADDLERKLRFVMLKINIISALKRV